MLLTTLALVVVLRLDKVLLCCPDDISIQSVNLKRAIFEVEHPVLHWSQLAQPVLPFESLLHLLFVRGAHFEHVRVEQIPALVKVVPHDEVVQSLESFLRAQLSLGLPAPSLNLANGTDDVEEGRFVALLGRQNPLHELAPAHDHIFILSLAGHDVKVFALALPFYQHFDQVLRRIATITTT